MKVATLVPYPIFPPDEGGRRRAYSLLKFLSREHEMLLLTPASPANAACDLAVRVIETGAPGRLRQIASPALYRRLAAIVRDERPDVLLLEFPWSGLHASLLARRHGVPFVLDAHNVEADRFRATGSRSAPLVSLLERVTARRAGRVWCVSPEDGDRFIARGVAPGRIDVVPNGVDPSVMHPDEESRAVMRASLGVAPGERVVLFFGQLDYAPNRDALAIIEREIAPRLAAMEGRVRIVVAGKGAPAAGTMAAAAAGGVPVTYAGAVPDIAACINAADVVIAPLTSGGGTRLKILESIACGAPVISTSLGAQGIDVAACAPLLTLADGWDAFAAALGRISGDKQRNVPAAFLDMYSWANIVQRCHWPPLRAPADRSGSG
jgi:glycosyltransferase involved in cell wall biosynthesis